MLSIIIGVLLIGFTVFACLPNCLNWGQEIVFVLKGAAPVLAAFVGIIACFIGVSDIRERQEARKEEQEALQEEELNTSANT